jgi:putative membrane protein
MRVIKHTGVAAWFVGFAALVGLMAWSGADLVVQAVASVGVGVCLVVLVRVATVSVAGAGWWMLFSPSTRPPLRICVLLRIVREAANTLLPMAQVGGDLIGARLLTFWGVRGPLAAANIIVDILMQAATQFQFAVIGLVTLIFLVGDGTVARSAATGLAIAAVALCGFYLAQRRSGQRIFAFVLGRLAGDRKWQVHGTVDQVYQNLAVIYADRQRLFASGAVHLVGWVIGLLEVYVALALMGHPINLGEALVIESLIHAVRGAAFAIPGALGAQEGGIVVLCAIFGIPADQALALSLLKRVADLAVGIPGLLAWQVLEGGRLRAIHGRREREPVPSFDGSPRDR